VFPVELENASNCTEMHRSKTLRKTGILRVKSEPGRIRTSNQTKLQLEGNPVNRAYGDTNYGIIIAQFNKN